MARGLLVLGLRTGFRPACFEMKTALAFLRAFRRGYTYDVQRNPYLWVGVFWGMVVPSFTIAIEMDILSSQGGNFLEVMRAHPTRVILLGHPVLLGILFGAMGTVRHDLEVENGFLIGSLERLAMTDPLTGLYNRRYVTEALNRMLVTARLTRKPISVILIDLDGFKAVNEEYGHPRGDRVLCEAAVALKAGLRRTDILGRHGGDEFILLNPADRASAERLVGRAVMAVRAATGLSLSSGVACWPEDGGRPDDLIGAADLRLGRMKKKSHATRRAADSAV